jgi:predicted secreted hydrolase
MKNLMQQLTQTHPWAYKKNLVLLPHVAGLNKYIVLCLALLSLGFPRVLWSYCEDLNWEIYQYNPAGSTIVFPTDEGRHDTSVDFPVEWWYANFHLTGDSGKEYGAFICFFKNPNGRLLAISDVEQKQNYTSTVPAAPLNTSTTELDITYTDEPTSPDRWYNITENSNMVPFQYKLIADGVAAEDSQAIKLDLNMRSLKAPMMAGGDGLVTIGAGWSYYYSHTKMDVSGSLQVHGITENVTGYAWIDHQWGAFRIDETHRWEWFSIKLDDLREIMVGNLWIDGQLQGDYAGGLNLLNADCSLELLGNHTITTLAHWIDPETDRVYSQKWRIQQASNNTDLIVTAAYNEQLIPTGPGFILPGSFWEGVCLVSGTIGGSPVNGKAYVEVTHFEDKPGRWAVMEESYVPQGDGSFSEVLPAEDMDGHDITWHSGSGSVQFFPSNGTSPESGDNRCFMYDGSTYDVSWWQGVFTQPSTEIRIQLVASDWNDGWADIYVDGVLAFSYNSHHADYTDVAIVGEGLSYQAHTVKIQTRASGGDVSLDYLAIPVEPVPTVSQRGLIVMTGLVLTAGAIVIWWRRKTRLA